MRVAIVGSRHFNDYELLKREMLLLRISNIIPTHIVSGGAKGADRLAEKFASEYNIPTTIYLPDWTRYGNRAGYLRNEKIVKDADCVIAFWDGESKGTKHSINLAEDMGKILHVILVNKTNPPINEAAIF